MSENLRIFLCPITVFRYPNYSKTLVSSVWILLKHGLLYVNPSKEQRSALVTNYLKVQLSNLKTILIGTSFYSIPRQLSSTTNTHKRIIPRKQQKSTDKTTKQQYKSTNSTASGVRFVKAASDHLGNVFLCSFNFMGQGFAQ